jgi:hypothetical protein
MADIMDIEARRDLAKLYTAHEKLATVVWGANGENGINSKVKNIIENHETLEKHVDDLEKWATDIWHVQRPANCIGKKAVDELEARMVADAQDRHKEMVEMKKARIAMYTALGVAVISTLEPIMQKLLGG